jgi:rhodanese-related sulfurtransferase
MVVILTGISQTNKFLRQTMTEIIEISPSDVQLIIQQGKKPFFVDVRNDDEVREVRAVGICQWMPLGEFDPSQLHGDPSEPIYLICRSGRRSYDAAVQCQAAGWQHVYNVEGGTLEWQAAGLPTETGPFSPDQP